MTALIREARADDPLARALEAILDSGLIVFSRDSEGRFVHLSEILSERAGLIADSGSSQPRNMRVFDEQGRLLPGSEYPAAITRMTGTPQRDVLRRLVSDDDREIWLKMNALPLERGAEGWSVLIISTDVTDLCEEIETGREEIAARGTLLKLSERLAVETLEHDDLLAAFRDPLAALLPGCNISVAQRDGGEFITTPLVDAYGEPRSPYRARYTPDQRERWTAAHAHVNPNVNDTDIYGTSVVAEFEHPIRSIAIAPCQTADPEAAAAIVVYAAEPDAFSDDQVASLEIAGRMLGRGLGSPQALAQAS